MAGEADKPDASAAETIFNAALPLSAAERAAYLVTACGDNLKLRQRVEALLRAHDAPEGFLPEQPARPPAATPTLAGFLAAQITEQPGDAIGRYKLREKLGEGGCGVVYMAEQEEPVRRKVALKVIKLGMDTRQVITRFEAERQALALMDHPNIARVLDAGATETGRPYFVMELVGGIKITDYCEQNHLNTQQRLDLFMQVCRAIQHAHQKGIIHRDIKPSNVLVTTHDGVPVPKVIDFGIAKATQGRLTDDTVFTAFEQFLGTPAYMSPEQAQVGGLDVDTRSDIYSLGVLLYELLTGRTPFDTKELLAAGLDAMRRTIQEKEPPTPSTRLKEELAASSGGSDKSALSTLHSPLDKDIDWIVMKCLEKDRARRYETANGLARDIERHLNDEPVMASPPSRLYRFQKLVRRNKVTAAATAVVAVVLFLGTFVSTWQALRATRAELHAKREAVKSQRVAQFLRNLLLGASPAVAQGRDATILRQLLNDANEQINKELTNEPEVAIDLRSYIVSTYKDLALYTNMERLAEENLTASRTQLGAEHPAVALALEQLGDAKTLLGNYGEGERFLHDAFALSRKVYGNEHGETIRKLFRLGQSLFYQQKFAEAEQVLREVVALDRKHFGPDTEEVASGLAQLGGALYRQGKLTEAERAAREALALKRKALGDTHPQTVAQISNLAAVLQSEGKFDESAELCLQALETQRKILEKDHPDLSYTLSMLARARHGQGQHAEAEALLREAIAIDTKSRGQADPKNVMMLATVLHEEGKDREVESELRVLLAAVRTNRPPKDPDLSALLAQLASNLISQGKFAEAESPARESLELSEKQTPDDWRVFNRRSVLGASLLGQRRYPEAEPLLIAGYEGMKEREPKIPLAAKPRLKETAQRLIELYEMEGKADQVAEWRKKLEGLDHTRDAKTADAPSPTSNRP